MSHIRRSRLPWVALLFGAISGCGSSMKRLDDAQVYKGPYFELKIVRYYESLPLHFTGEISVVQCRSPKTSGMPAGRTNDEGWKALGRVGALGSRSAEELVERVRREYLPIGDRILLWTSIVLMISDDGCNSFSTWDPISLPAEMILPVEKPDYCAPKGPADCRYEGFRGDRQPTYSEVRAIPNGAVSFLVRSRAFKTNQAFHVSSPDFGRTWQVSAVPGSDR
jgi:hypothetical protein